MSAVGAKLRNVEGGRLLFRCPGCERPHQIKIGEGPGPRWTWNGRGDEPTFSPSILVTWTEPSDIPEESADESKDIKMVCHSYVRDGRIEFLSDCTHAMAGETVELPDFEISS